MFMTFGLSFLIPKEFKKCHESSWDVMYSKVTIFGIVGLIYG